MLPETDGDVLARMALEKLAWFDGEMTGRSFVCGDRFTLADIHLYVFLDFFETLGLHFPRELAWVGDFYRRAGARESALA
jgi:glutathione S-transferase